MAGVKYVRLLAKPVPKATDQAPPKAPKAPEAPKATKAPPPEATLPGHTARVLVCVKRVLKHIGAVALDSTGLADTPAMRDLWTPRLDLALTLGGFWHDLGKANDHFQSMIRRQRGGRRQAVRHESVSGLLLVQDKALRPALFAPVLRRDPLVAWAALAAVCGHHAKFPARDGFAQHESGDHEVVVDLAHPDMLRMLRIGHRVLTAAGMAPPSLSAPQARIAWPCPGWRDRGIDGDIEAMRDQIEAGLAQHNAGVGSDGAESRFVALVKGLLVAADVAGSALPQSLAGARPRSLADWLDRALTPTFAGKDGAHIVATRLGDTAQPRPFQDRVAKSRARVTLVRAGCGSGKTVAAYQWAAHHAAGRRLIFCYPTTGTATEGFRDYLSDIKLEQDERSSALIHSRAEVDLEQIQSNVPQGAPRYQEDQKDGLQRLDSLRAWCPKVISCTADTVLGALVFNRPGLFAFPTLCRGAYIFDEIHAYDERMFGLLLRFLQLFCGAPVLLMTASLPPARLTRLRECIAELNEIEGPADHEGVQRYHLAPEIATEVPWQRVTSVLDHGGKVLCISNRVAGAMARAQAAEQYLPHSSVYTYHSRFCYKHRVDRHNDLIAAFANQGPVFASTTQVAEMSLDLSADLLVTELAPPHALIQRLGRLNRRARGDDPRPAVALAAQAPPYTNDELAQGCKFWQNLAGRPISQRDLADEFAASAAATSPQTYTRSPLQQGGAHSQPESVRNPGFTVTVLLERDRNRVRKDAREAVRCELPLALSELPPDWYTWARCRFRPVVPSGIVSYDERRGARVR